MVDESIPARQPALSPFALPRARRSSPRFAVKLIAALSLVLAAPALGFAPAPAVAAAVGPALVTEADAPVASAAADDLVTVELAPAGSPVVQPGQDLVVTATISNGGADAINSGNLDLYLAGRALTTQAALDAWLDPETDADGDLLAASPTAFDILPGNTSVITVTVPSAALGLTEDNGWGARGIAARLTLDSTPVAEGRSTFVWYPAQSVTPVNFTVVMPITTPAGSVGIIPATALESYTSPTGLLTRQLDGVINTPVALGIDPMIIASIRLLGSDAPASALGWLDRLTNATNETFPLQYADADIALEAQTSGLLSGPLSFDFALDPAAFEAPVPPVPAADSEPDEQGSFLQGMGIHGQATQGQSASVLPAETDVTPTPSPTSTPTPTPAPNAEPVLPTAKDLLAFDYTTTTVGWPASPSVSASDLNVFAASGLKTTLLSSAQVTRSDASTTPSASVTLDGGVGLVASDTLSAAVTGAAMATTDEEWHASIAVAASELAVSAANQYGTAPTVVAALDRGWPQSAVRLSQTIATLSSIPWQASSTLQQAIASPADSTATFQSESEDATRVELGTRMVDSETALTQFSTAIPDPLALTAPERLEHLALFATSWANDQEAWTAAVGTNLTDARSVIDSVAVTTKGPINVLASQVDIPITLTNDFDQAVSVRLALIPSNARLVVGDEVEETIDANSGRTIKVPVSAKVGNGDVTLRATVYSPTGVQLGDPVPIDVNVQAEWEGVGALIFGIAVVLFFGYGVWRNITGRRKHTADAGTTEPTVTPDEPVTEVPASLFATPTHDEDTHVANGKADDTHE